LGIKTGELVRTI